MSNRKYTPAVRRARDQERQRRSSSVRGRATSILSQWHPEDWEKAKALANEEFGWGPLPGDDAKTKPKTKKKLYQKP